jgi:hypothetical protein
VNETYKFSLPKSPFRSTLCPLVFNLSIYKNVFERGRIEVDEDVAQDLKDVRDQSWSVHFYIN